VGCGAGVDEDEAEMRGTANVVGSEVEARLGAVREVMKKGEEEEEEEEEEEKDEKKDEETGGSAGTGEGVGGNKQVVGGEGGEGVSGAGGVTVKVAPTPPNKEVRRRDDAAESGAWAGGTGARSGGADNRPTIGPP
jgi:hypothetical protein